MKSLTKQLFLLTALLALINSVNAQVGIGTNNPNPKVILDIKSVDKGVLLPRTDSTYGDMTPYNGSLVYDSLSNKFKYCADTTWLSVNPLTTNFKDNKIGVEGELTVKTNLTVNGKTVNMPNATVTANDFVGNGTIPLGGIIMWSGAIANKPEGWELCDGKKYTTKIGELTTPDLQGRFVVGYNPNNQEYDAPRKASGNDMLMLTNDNLPTHQHEKGTLTTSLGGLHQHGYIGYEAVKDGGGEHVKSRLKDGNDADYGGEPSGEHNHAITGLTNFTGGVYHPDSRVYDYSGTNIVYTCNASLLKEPANEDVCECTEFIHGEPNPNYYDGNGACLRKDYNPNYGDLISGVPEYWTIKPFDNRPAYYVLAFIMRVK